MRLSKYLALLLLLLPLTSHAALVQWNRDAASTTIWPQFLLDIVKGNYFIATSTTNASVFPYASTTALSVSGLTSGNCVQAGTGGLLTTTAAPCGTGGSSTFGTTSISALWPINWNTTNAQISWTGLATSSAISSGQVLYATGPGTFTSVATSTLTPTSPLTGSFTQLGSGGSVGCQTASGSQAGCLSSADWTTFNGKQAAGNYITALTGDITASGPGSVAATLATVNSNVGSFTNSSITVNAKGLITAASSGSAPEVPLSFTWPLIRTVNTVSFGGLSTSSPAVVGNIPYFSGVNTLANVATGTITCSSGASCGSGSYVIGSNLAITGSGVDSIAGTANQITASASTGDVTLSLPNHVIFPGSFQVSKATTSNATTSVSQYFPYLGTAAGAFLAVDPTGKLIATTTPAGGGGTPGGSDTQVQYNNSGSFGGSSTFTFTNLSYPAITIGTEDGLGALVAPNATTGDTAGGALGLASGAGNGAADGGNLVIESGSGGATSGTGGDISINAGSAQGGDSNGGDITLISGAGIGSGVSGVVYVESPDGNGILIGGDGNTQIHNGDSGGDVLLRSGSGAIQNAVFNTASLTADRTFSFPDFAGTFALGSYTTGFLDGYIPFGSSGLLATSSLLSFDGTRFNTTYASTTAITATSIYTTNAKIGSGTGLLLTTSGVTSNYAGTSCTNQFVRSLSASGAATCATVSSSDVSLANLTATDATLTFSGTYNGSTARTIGLNLGNGNTWTALQQFALASSTQFSAASQKFYIDSTGKVTMTDVTTSYVGQVTPLRYVTLGTATTTTWTASTTGSGASPFATAPFAGTLKSAVCKTYVGSSGGSFIGVNTKVNGSNATPSYFVASSTVGTITYTAGNTFTAGQTILLNFGTTTTATVTSISCTLTAVQT